MRRFIRNRIVIFVAVAWFMYWPIAAILPQDIILELINGLIASLSVGLVVAYIPGVWYRLRMSPYQISGADMLVLGIATVQIAIASLFVWAWVYRILDTPEWMVDHPFRGWIVYLLALGGVLHLMASDVGISAESIPDRVWMHLGIAVAVGMMVGVLVLAFGV